MFDKRMKIYEPRKDKEFSTVSLVHVDIRCTSTKQKNEGALV